MADFHAMFKIEKLHKDSKTCLLLQSVSFSLHVWVEIFTFKIMFFFIVIIILLYFDTMAIKFVVLSVSHRCGACVMI